MNTLAYNKNYQRIVYKGEIPFWNNLGVNIVAINMECVLNYLNCLSYVSSGVKMGKSGKLFTALKAIFEAKCRIENGW